MAIDPGTQIEIDGLQNSILDEEIKIAHAQFKIELWKMQLKFFGRFSDNLRELVSKCNNISKEAFERVIDVQTIDLEITAQVPEKYDEAKFKISYWEERLGYAISSRDNMLFDIKSLEDTGRYRE